MNYFKSLLLILVVSVVSCETIIDLDVPRKDTKMVLNSFFNPDSTFKVFLHRDLYILDEEDFYEGTQTEVMDATIELFDSEGNLVTNFEYRSKGEYRSDFIPARGEEYLIRAKKEGFKTISSTGSIPNNLASFEVLTINYLRGYDYEFEIKINDLPGENYYEIQSWEEANIVYDGDAIKVVDPSPLVSDELYIDENATSAHSIYLSDELFQNQEIDLKINTLWQLQGKCSREDCFDYKVYITVRSLSKEYFQYRQSSGLQSRLENDVFAEPVNVFTNITNGFGIFAGFNNHDIEVELSERTDD